MKRAVRSLILLSLFLSLAVIALPLALTADDTVSGKVTAVGDKAFTVEKDGGGAIDFVTDVLYSLPLEGGPRRGARDGDEGRHGPELRSSRRAPANDGLNATMGDNNLKQLP